MMSMGMAPSGKESWKPEAVLPQSWCIFGWIVGMCLEQDVAWSRGPHANIFTAV